MPEVFKELAESVKYLKDLDGINNISIGMQYFSGKDKELLSEERLKKATGCKKAEISYSSGAVAEECSKYPDQIDDSYATALHICMDGVGQIGVFPGRANSILKGPRYSWLDREGNEDVCSRVDDVLKNLGWEKVSGMFISERGLS